LNSEDETLEEGAVIRVDDECGSSLTLFVHSTKPTGSFYGRYEAQSFSLKDSTLKFTGTYFVSKQARVSIEKSFNFPVRKWKELINIDVSSLFENRKNMILESNRSSCYKQLAAYEPEFPA
jgi:hypothetical protein